MTDDSVTAPDVIDDGQADVLAEDEVVHVPDGVRELADSIGHGDSFLPEVADWDGPPDEAPEF
ncbi:hypothetical protein [Rugosimonospora acidiphila]